MTQGYKTSSSNFVLRQSLYLASQDDFLSLFVQFLGSWVSSRGELRRYGSRGANRQSSKSLAFVTSRHCGAPSKDSAPIRKLGRSAGKSDRGSIPCHFWFWRAASFHSSRYERTSHCKLDQFGAASNMKTIHHRIFVKSNGAWRDVKCESNFLHRATLGEELKNFFLSQG